MDYMDKDKLTRKLHSLLSEYQLFRQLDYLTELSEVLKLKRGTTRGGGVKNWTSTTD